MKNYLFVHRGYDEKKEGMEAAWGEWFGKVGENVVDPGAPFASGRLISGGEVSDIDLASGLTGYMMIKAENMDAAEAIAKGMPVTHGMEIYEVRAM